LTPTVAASSKLRVWLAAQARDRHGDQFGMGSVAREARIAARTPNFRANPLGRTSLDQTGEIAPGHARQRCLAHSPRDVLHVARID